MEEGGVDLADNRLKFKENLSTKQRVEFYVKIAKILT